VFLRFSLFSWLLAFCSSLLCVVWVPAAEGSGIPDVKAYLNGVRVKRFSSFSLFFVKIVGTILSVASSLAVGKEGPLIHIGAIVGAGCSKLSIILSHLLATPFTSGFVSPSENGMSFLTRLWLWTTSDLAYFVNDTEKRDLVTIGAAVGFAASFGAPIGGLLFVLDDISTYFDKSMSLRVLVANALGTFCLAIYRGDLSQYSVISLVCIRTCPPSAQ
jgi:chloride channel 7